MLLLPHHGARPVGAGRRISISAARRLACIKALAEGGLAQRIDALVARLLDGG
jgi:hypothetical protein